MRVFALAVAIGVAAFGMAQAQVVAPGSQQVRVGPMQGWGLGSTYNDLWERGTPISLNGRVAGRMVVSPIRGMAHGVVLTVTQPDREGWEVHLGPQWFIDNVGMRISPGDEILVTGRRVTLDGRSVVVAQTVLRGGSELFLRNNLGYPVWDTSRGAILPPQLTVPDQQVLDGQIVDSGVMNINGSPHLVYRLQTGTGFHDVVAGPAWFMQQQPIPVQFPYNVTFYGTPVGQLGTTTFMASGMQTPYNSFVFLNGTVGLWNPGRMWW
jgi:hypothetical protein